MNVGSSENDQLGLTEKGHQPQSSDNSTKETTEEVELDVLNGFQSFMLVFAISLAGFLYALDVNIIVTAVPVITSHFQTIKDIGWYGSAYLITLCACTPVVGKIYQYYNAKILFFSFVVIFEIGSLICGVAPTSTSLVIGRAVAGIGGAGLFTGGLTIVALSLPKEKRAQTVAFVYVFSMLGSIVAPILGGVLTEKVSWRWCFYINLPAGAVTLAIIAIVRIPERRHKIKTNPSLLEAVNRLDPVGFLLFAPACVMILLALQWGGSTYPWNSSKIIGLFVGFVACLIAFIVWESRQGDTAMVPLQILRQRVVYSSCLVTMTQYGSMQVVSYYLPVWFQTILGVGPILSGSYFMATAGPIIASTVIAGVIASKIGNPALFSIVGNAVAAVGTGLMSTFTPTTRIGIWAGFQVITGLGRGMTMQQPVNAVQHTLLPAQMSVGTSIVVFCQFFGGALVLALAETDFSSSLRTALKTDAPGVNATLILEVGAARVRDVVQGAQLEDVLTAYNDAIVNTLYLGAGFAVLAFLAAWGMGLKGYQNHPTEEIEASEVSQEV